MKKKIFYACDYRGVDLKNEIIKIHEQKNLNKLFNVDYENLGIEHKSLLDYIDISKKLADRLKDNTDAIGVIICGSGQGIAIALNRFSHIRATMCRTKEDAIQTREKLNANVIALGSKYTSPEEAITMLSSFIKKDFLPKKHEKCVQKLAFSQTMHAQNGVNLIVRAIIKHENHILLTTVTPENDNFPQNLYFLPGGHVNHNEPAAIGLKREIWEEMNLPIAEMHFLEALECSWDKKSSIYHEIDLIYEVKINGLNISKPPKSVDHGFQTFVWVPLSQLDKIKILPYSLKEIIINSCNPLLKAKFLSEMMNNSI